MPGGLYSCGQLYLIVSSQHHCMTPRNEVVMRPVGDVKGEGGGGGGGGLTQSEEARLRVVKGERGLGKIHAYRLVLPMGSRTYPPPPPPGHV